ncbi:epoxide hydrolase [Colletotrichum cuscutae]|uniref:Epoxide hydrolase n=1 Tax=Colletotrichum cuscutae TaxID=1209917 RepID=A0AAI9VGJ2_9PEZI|nr:epoxide hydrolase [Colletotrichum cuscutae]
MAPSEEFNLHILDSRIEDFASLLLLQRSVPKPAKDAWLELDWRKQEDCINSFPNFNVTIDDVDAGPTNIHFVGLYSKRSDALPLLFLHGWPGSFLEFLPLLDILKSKYTPETLPYHVIVRSLPNYGLSGGPIDIELTLETAARLMNELMITLGFDSG